MKNIAYVGRKESNYLSDICRTTVINTLKENNLNLKLDDKGDFIYEVGYDFVQKNRHQLQDIDCIICANDLITFGVKSALDELNYKIPEDILITGYDDIMYSSMSQPTLTSVRQPSYLLGSVSCQQLINYVTEIDLTTNKTIVLPQTLIIRESTENN